MHLSSRLRHAIEAEVSRYNLHSVGQAAAELSEMYRAQCAARGSYIASEAHRAAYAAVRLPATFAAVSAVLSEVQRLMPESPITSLLDLGAGPGTAGWAATQVFDGLRQITNLESDEGWIRMGKSLARSGGNALLENAQWTHADLSAARPFPAHDLVVGSYALGEMAPNALGEALVAAWSAARAAVVIVEPGTMAGFHLVRRLRDDLTDLGGHVVAPCPHSGSCPVPADDWCHFSQRLERSSQHRRLKTGSTLGYEDEKFSYVVASKKPVDPACGRIVRHPFRQSGHVRMVLCTRDGMRTVTVTRSDKEYWRRARKAAWGDAWP